MEIYLVRHGQTDWNLQGKIQGHTDMPLNENGRRQAEELAEKLTEKKITEIYCSSLQRAIDTAVIVGEKLGVPVYMTDGLIERGCGVLEGMTIQEARESYPREVTRWFEDPLEAQLPGEDSETGMQVLKRAYGALCDILERAKGDVLIVTHGGTIQVLLSYLLRDTPEYIPEKIPNGTILTLRYSRLTQDIAWIEE